ncbi:MAG: DNA repair protein RecN [Alphaproteobacteria bacterium]|nr:DNA repair protein RecN [Alphaproteobacteria bacterium]
MLLSLTIWNVVLIDKLVLEVHSGLCALTGETGAGKSILLDSLGLALGARAEARLVRRGADQAIVSAEFQVSADHPAFIILHNSNLGGVGIFFSSGERPVFSKDGSASLEEGVARKREAIETLILRRTLSPDGRSRAFINDQPVSAGLLRQVGETLVEIHGQFDMQGLLDAATHGRMLDEYAGTGGALEEHWSAWKSADESLRALKAHTQQTRADEAYLRAALEDLDGVQAQPGEEARLAGLREGLIHKEQALEALNAAHYALTGEHDPVRKAQALLSRSMARLGRRGEEIMDALERANVEIQEATGAINGLSANLEEGDDNLVSIDDRLHLLRAQARKHGCTVEELPDMREKIAAQLNAIEHADELLAAAMKEAEKTRASYVQAARAVSDSRRKAAKKLDALVQKELPPLKLDKAQFVTDIQEFPESEWGPSGIDRMRFLVATNPGAEPGPLNKIASGGEMARFMLALKVSMAEADSAQTLIFDEVDAGVGGAVADAVGERLARLAQGRQVLVVTHAPQIAARADHHWIVRKGGIKEVITTIEPLESAQARREEIARMLAGATVTEEARAAADRLLETGT